MDSATPPEGASVAVARRLAPDHVRDGHERPITVDQTNLSVVVDEAVIVKWFRPPVPLPHPALDLLTHLRAVGFVAMPAFYGVHSEDSTVVAMVAEFVAGSLDGWDWFVDDVLAAGDTVDGGATVLADADAIGRLAGALHVAAATPSTVLPEPVLQVDARAEVPRAMALLDEALRVTDGEAAAVLRACAGRLRDVFAAWPAGDTLAIRLHGDFHVGQILRADARLVVTDFDGNPLLDAADRHAFRPAAVDVASLVQSLDHAVRIAQRRRPDRADALDLLVAPAIAAALDGYRAVLAASGHGDLLDERLLQPLRAAQELHELVYAARHLPRWAYAPTATLRAMFAGDRPHGTR